MEVGGQLRTLPTLPLLLNMGMGGKTETFLKTKIIFCPCQESNYTCK